MQLVPYLTFNGKCREALTYYAEKLGGTIEAMDSFGSMPAGDNPMQPADAAHIMHGRVRLGDMLLMASDSFDAKGDYAYTGISLSMQVDDLADAKSKFEALSKDGMVIMPFEATFWAKGFGVLKDKFGISWMINCE